MSLNVDYQVVNLKL